MQTVKVDTCKRVRLRMATPGDCYSLAGAAPEEFILVKIPPPKAPARQVRHAGKAPAADLAAKWDLTGPACEPNEWEANR